MKSKLTLSLMFLLLLTIVSCQSLSPTAAGGDEAIAAELRSRIQSEIPNKTFTLGIDVDKGHVTIDGVVDTAEDRRIISELASNIDGVRRVTNRLGIRP